MEPRIKRYLTFRRLNYTDPPEASHTTDEPDLIGIPYEGTHKGRAPMLSPGPRTRESVRSKDQLDAHAIRTLPYTSVVAGTPPVFGATPIKGNGPVKLQTSRRLSSGELLVTTQDRQRTLTDIRDGEYIVGRKDSPRLSKSISIKPPSHSKASSPRTSATLAPQKSSLSPGQSPRLEQKLPRNHVPDPITVDKGLETTEVSPPGVSPCSPHNRRSSATRAYVLGPTEIPLPLSPGKAPSSRNSLLSRGEEQNATIHALWKAEYTRLVAIYGQDGVDRNIAELNKVRAPLSPGKRFSLDPGAGKLSVASGAPVSPSLNTVIPPMIRTPRSSLAQELPSADNGSDYSSVKVPSLLSSEESSSSYTKRTSLFETDVPTTREEVSRIVESMRKNYLKALEAKAAEEKPKTKRPKKSKLRASYTHTSIIAAAAPLKASKTGRQSWHASTIQTAPKQEKQSKKRAMPTFKTTGESAIGPLKTAASKSSLRGKPPLHRADSTTLGSFFSQKKNGRNSPSPAGTLKASTSPLSSKTAEMDDARPSTNESAYSKSSVDNIAPDIDDFDIFYQDLARGSGPSAGNVKLALPAIHGPQTDQTLVGPHDAAPPPPDIDVTPRKRPFLGVF